MRSNDPDSFHHRDLHSIKHYFSRASQFHVNPQSQLDFCELIDDLFGQI